MELGERQLSNIVAVGRVTPRSVRIWARVECSGPVRLEVTSERASPTGADEHLDSQTLEVFVDFERADGCAAWTVPDEVPGARPLRPSTRYRVTLWAGDEVLGRARFSTPPPSRAEAPRRWTFAALSCHQPFSTDGTELPAAHSMLAAARKALRGSDARFALLMGDQMYADYPPSYSLFEDNFFARVAPQGRESLLDCDADEVRALYHTRHRQFWALEDFAGLQSDLPCYPMLDDHEVVDNFGTHPDHAQPHWNSVREGALQAVYDYQISRVLPPSPEGRRPSSFDYGFTWGQAAVWVADIRSQRETQDDRTRVFTEAQNEAFERFLLDHGDLPLLVLMVPIPLVHVDGRIANVVAGLLGKGSDVHERWSHAQCVQERDRLFGRLIAHSRRHPHQTILIVGGDVHAGAAFQIDFDVGVQLIQFTSSAVSNRESTLVGLAAENATKTVRALELPDDVHGEVSLIPSGDPERARNPFGNLNVGLVDVIDHGDRVSVSLRLVSHDDRGGPVIVYDSGEIGQPELPERRLLGIVDVANVAEE